MNLGKLLKNLAIVALPVAATAVAGPGAGAAAVAVLGGGKVGHVIGEKIEDKTGRPADKLTAPAGSVLAALAVVQFLGPEKIEHVCGLLQAACASPTTAAVAIIGIGTAIYRYLITVAEKVSKGQG